MAGREIHAPLIGRGGAAGGPCGGEQPRAGCRRPGRAPGGGGGRDRRTALVAGREIDVVVLAIAERRPPPQGAVVEAGAAIVVDKPLAVTPPTAAVVRHAAAAGVPLTVFQNRRYDAEQATVARVVAEGWLGTSPLRDAVGALAPGAQGALARAGHPRRGRRSPARPAAASRRRGVRPVRSCRNGLRHGRGAHHRSRRRDVPRLPTCGGGSPPRARPRWRGRPAPGCGCSAPRRPT